MGRLHLYVCWFFLVVVIGGVPFGIYEWRCPNCRKYLGLTWNPRYCRKCGAHLQ